MASLLSPGILRVKLNKGFPGIKRYNWNTVNLRALRGVLFGCLLGTLRQK